MNLLVHLCQNNVTKTETIIIDEILNTVPNVGFKSPFLSSRIVNFIFTPFQVKCTVLKSLNVMSHGRLKVTRSNLDIFSMRGYFSKSGYFSMRGYFFQKWIFCSS